METAILTHFFSFDLALLRLTARGEGLPYITDGDARRNFEKKPLKLAY